jgi:uncharacterized membrane protein YjfL (UPF0719 family)
MKSQTWLTSTVLLWSVSYLSKTASIASLIYWSLYGIILNIYSFETISRLYMPKLYFCKIWAMYINQGVSFLKIR